MGLYGDVPSGIRLGVFDDRPDDPVVTAPFGLQVQSAPGGYPGGVGLGPSEVFLAFDDHFQFVGSRINTVYGGLLSFGGEADPTDGKMKMILVPGRGFFYKMKMLFAAILNRQEVLENSSSWRMVSEAKIRNKEGVPLSINVDGELEIAEEFTIRVNRGGMQFVEPKDIDRSNITWKKKVDLHKY